MRTTYALVYHVKEPTVRRVMHRGAFCPAGGLSELEADEAKVRLLRAAEDRGINRHRVTVEKVPYAFDVLDHLPDS